MNHLTIGIIGFGRFGQILTKHILNHLPQSQVLVSSSQKNLKLPPRVTQVSFKTAAQCLVVIPCVPISVFEKVIVKLKPHIKPNALVIDVCSVKTHPVKMMKKHLSKNINILATHPMWGPDSAKHSLKGLTTVLCPIRLSKSQLSLIKRGLEKLGQKVFIMSPQKHDQFLARSQAITHLFGRVDQKLNIKSTPIDTQGFKQLLKIQSFVTNDTWQLFLDMFKFNPHALKTLNQVQKALSQIEKQINL